MEVLQSNNWEKFSENAVRNAAQFDWQQVTYKLMDVYCKLNPGAFYE